MLASLLVAACGGGGQSTDTASAENSKRATLLGRKTQSIAAPAASVWSPLIPLSLVPTSAANLPNGKVLLWSSNSPFSFGGSGQTYTTQFDPATQTATDMLVNQTGHDMFCTGISNLPDGTLLINGGDDSSKTSLYNPATDTWSIGATMNIARGYEGNTVLQDGSVFTYGGSWSGGQGNKHAEVWTASAGWQRLYGVPIDPAIGPDPAGVYRGDNHLWLFAAPNGKVLQAGPSANMNWIDPQGSGSIAPAGTRGDDAYSQNGNAVMYDIGKILKVGGAPAYENVAASAASYVIDINAGASARKIAPMIYPRMYANSVVLPNGQVVVIGGQTFGKQFSDDNSVLVPELWDPVTETFSLLPPIAVGRNYHSVGLLLPDARVLSGGSGLCGSGCAGNHPDLQILTPNYLINADGTPTTRPVISSAPAKAALGTSFGVTTDSSIASFVLMRLASNTHSVNNDQRRIPLSFSATNTNTYTLNVPSNPGVALPGYYMLFAMNAQGVPSVASMVQIAIDGLPMLRNPGTQTGPAGSSVQVSLNPGASISGLSYSASGLPDGLVVNTSTGLISGTPTRVGQFAVTLSASNAVGTTSTNLLWTITEAITGVAFVKLEALSEVGGNPWSSMAEFNLLDGNGAVLPRTGWTVSADSAETQAENGSPVNAIDGNPATVWETDYSSTNPAPPHAFVVNLGSARVIGGFKVLPRATSTKGTIASWRFSTSPDGANWTVLATGNFNDFANNTTEKAIYLNNLARGKPATQSSTYNNRAAAIAVDGNTAGNGEALVSHTQSDLNAWWQVDLGAVQALNAVRLWNRTDCCANRLSNFYLLVSATDMTGRTLANLLADTSVWRTQVTGAAGHDMLVAAKATGRYVRVQLAGTNFLALAEVEAFGRTPGNRSPTLAAIPPPTHAVGQTVSLGLSASDPDGDAVTFSAAGLPPGLTLNSVSGVISGVPSTAGVYNVTVQAADALGGSGSAAFVWSITPPPLNVAPLAIAPVVAGNSASFTASSNGSAGVAYRWNFGDGTPDTALSSDPTATHSYAAPGLYTITLTAVDTNGSTAVRSFIQAIYNPPSGSTQPTQSADVALERRGGAGNDRVWLVNQDNDSISAFDAVTLLKVAEVSVGAAPRSLAIAPDGRIWVANKGGATLSVVNPANFTLAQTIAMPRASMPYGIVFAPDGSAAYVTLEATGQLLKLDPGSGALLGTLALGPNPRHLSITAGSDRALVSRYITPPLPGEGTAAVQTQAGSVKLGGEVLVVNLAALTLERTIELQHSEKPDSTAQGRGIPNYLGAAVISPDGASAWVPSKQDNIKRGSLRDGQNLTFESTVRAISSRIDLATLTEDYAARIDHDNSGLGAAAVFHPTGAFLFVALPASRHIAVVDPVSKEEVFRVNAGRAPDGLSVSADGLRLYVNNAMDRTLGVYDLSRLVNFGEQNLPKLGAMNAVAVEKLAPQVLKGKQLFYDAIDSRLARDAYLSCASCHNDGRNDGRTWDFTGLGEGLRNTISLRGHAGGRGVLHWSQNFDEVQDFEGQLRSLAGGTGLMTDAQFNTGTRSQPLGDKKAGVSADLDALAAYLASLDTFDPTPLRNADGSLSPDAFAGRSIFGANCAQCHGGSTFTDSQLNGLQNIGTLKASSGSRLGAPLVGITTPSLRDAWATAPYLHDGSAPTLSDAVQAHANVLLTAQQIDQVAAFVSLIGAEEPPVLPLGGGLRARYFANNALNGNHVLQRVEAVSFDWGTASPGAGIPADNFSVRWTGDVRASASGSYQFQTVANDGVRVWLNGVPIINRWVAQAVSATVSSTVYLVAGQRNIITIEYSDMSASSQMRLMWKAPGSTAFVDVPASALFPTLYPAATSLAIGKPASQSSTYNNRSAATAVDGATSGKGEAMVSHTNSDLNAWWQVDLTSSRMLDAVHLWNRTDCCSNRLSNFYVFVSDTDLTGRTYASLLSDPTVWRYQVPPQVGSDLLIPVGVRGRYVRVQLAGTNNLALAEVEVWGQ